VEISAPELAKSGPDSGRSCSNGFWWGPENNNEDTTLQYYENEKENSCEVYVMTQEEIF
jgi:hypothetical protein